MENEAPFWKMETNVGSRLQIELHSYNALFTSRVFSTRLNVLKGKPSNWFLGR